MKPTSVEGAAKETQSSGQSTAVSIIVSQTHISSIILRSPSSYSLNNKIISTASLFSNFKHYTSIPASVDLISHSNQVNVLGNINSRLDDLNTQIIIFGILKLENHIGHASAPYGIVISK